MDTNQNDQVSKEEFMRFSEAEFGRMDVDHSGFLTPKEFTGFRFRYSPGYVGGTTHR